MPATLAQVAKEAMDLPPRQKLALAGILLECAEIASHSEAEALWDVEIRDRIDAIDAGSVVGISYEDVSRSAEERLAL